MPRPPCIYAPGGTMHVVARCKILGVRSLLLLFLTMGTREIIFQDGFEAVMNINKRDLTPGF